MCAAISTISSRFKKEELIILLNKFDLPINGTKYVLSERIHMLKKSMDDLKEILELEQFGYLRCKIKDGIEIKCCICLRKGYELDMYSCKTCKEGILCPDCIENDEYELVDDNYNQLCPICKTSKLFSNYEKNKIKEKCNLMKEISETSGMSMTSLCDIIKKIKLDNPNDEKEPIKSLYKLEKALCNKLNITFQQSIILIR